MPNVNAPAFLAFSRTRLMSVPSPDCETPTTSAFLRFNFAWYNVWTDGAANETGIRDVISRRYRPNSAALSEEPRATSTINRMSRVARNRLNGRDLGDFFPQRSSECLRLLLDFLKH